MQDIAAHSIEKSRPWPLTGAARNQLIEEIARLHAELSSLAGMGLEEGIVRLPVALTTRRLETLKNVLAGGEVVDGDRYAAIGRRATLSEDGGESMTYEIVLPGVGEPTNGCVSADSPLGLAILGAQAGDIVDVRAPSGAWSVTVVSVDEIGPVVMRDAE